MKSPDILKGVSELCRCGRFYQWFGVRVAVLEVLEEIPAIFLGPNSYFTLYRVVVIVVKRRADSFIPKFYSAAETLLKQRILPAP